MDEDQFDEEDIKTGSRQFLIWDCCEYCKDRGFNSSQIKISTEICLNLFDAIKDETELRDLVQLFHQELIKSQNTLPSRCCTILSDYVGVTLLQHFSLYKLAKTEARQVIKKAVKETVEILEQPAPFSTGIPHKIWEYNQKIKEIEKEVVVIDSKLAEEVVELKTDRKKVNKQLVSLPLPGDDRLSLRERVREMIHNSVSTQTELINKMMLHELGAGQEVLAKDIQKAMVARPSVLGTFPMRAVPSRGASREVRDLNSAIASRMSTSQEGTRKSAGKSRASKK